jgi:acyl-[acyl-carrier-protein]-phospholipid O-acyltransferase/long-chain-fatty-acid--[acyl-carrier-protein] ligase
VHIEGSQYTFFTHLKGAVKRRIFPRITLTLLPGRKMQLSDELSGQKRRQASVEYLTALMREAKFQAGEYNTTLLRSLLKAKKIHGGRHVIIEDIKRKPLNYKQLIFRIVLLGRLLEKETSPHQAVGMFLPNTVIATVMIYALHLCGRYPAMLNYGAGKKALLSCIANADIHQVYTSRTFIKEGGLEDLLQAISEHAEVRYVEDMAGRLSLGNKLGSYLLALFAGSYYKKYEKSMSADDTAIILFTSGSEGLPKGVVLSHRNLLSNCWQVNCILDLSHKDVLLNFLPIFHSFGLTAGTILPLEQGIRFMQYPSPLHYKIIPELAYETDTSVIFATNTFLNGYGHQAHPYDFHSLRYVFAGAEPLKEQTEKLWMEKFGLRILEGYGVTETSPVLAANTVLTYRKGAVGHFVPGIEYRLIDVPGIENGKRLQIKGPNVMKGYLLPGHPGEITPPSTAESGPGWYDTGDIVDVDEDGYVFIRGRAKRFAKIGGEMVSLMAVENMVAKAWPEYTHAVITLTDSSKGEQIVLLTEYRDAKRKELVALFRQEGLSDLHIPKKIEIIEQLPLLPSGKIDYVVLQEDLASTQ